MGWLYLFFLSSPQGVGRRREATLLVSGAREAEVGGTGESVDKQALEESSSGMPLAQKGARVFLKSILKG